MRVSFGNFQKQLRLPNQKKSAPPIWIAACDPSSHEFAISNGCNVQVTPLWNDDNEVVDLMAKFNANCEKNAHIFSSKNMLLRYTYVADSEEDAQLGAEQMNRFYNFFGLGL